MANWKWTPPACGNYLVRWQCDVGGDISEFVRNFSVIDGKWAVVIVHTNANGNHPPEKHLHRLRIPSVLFSGLPLWGDYANPHSLAGISRDARQFGDDYLISLWQSNTYVEGEAQDESATSFSHEPANVQQAILRAYRALLAACRFDPVPTHIMISAMSNEVMQSMREAGYDVAGGLYADQNWDDAGGRVQIDHWGMPSRPFFMSTQDFRKEGDGGPRGMIGIQQCHRHTVLCRDYNCVFSLEPGADYMMDRYQGIHRQRSIAPIAWLRETMMFDSILASADLTREPLFFTCCFEFAGFDWMPEMYQIQEAFAEYLARECGSRTLAPATISSVADFYRRHYTETPESVVYLPDVWAGRVDTGYDRPRPAVHPDTMEIENGTFKSIFRKGDLLPYVHYDYTTRWGYPHADLSGAPRNRGGYVIPNTDDRFKILPPTLDTRGFKSRLKMQEVTDGTEIRIEIDSSVSQDSLTLAVWDIPRDFTSDSSTYSLTGAKRLIPVRAPYTSNLCAIIVADIKSGANLITLRVASSPRKPLTLDLRLAGKVLAKVFDRPGQPVAYVYTTGDEAESIQLRLPAGKIANLYPYVAHSDTSEDISGEVSVKLMPTEYRIITGLSCDELREAVAGAEPVQITASVLTGQAKH